MVIWWTGLAPWEFEFPFPRSFTSTVLEVAVPPRIRPATSTCSRVDISKSVISYISWDLLTPVIRRITFRADNISARAVRKLCAADPAAQSPSNLKKEPKTLRGETMFIQAEVDSGGTHRSMVSSGWRATKFISHKVFLKSFCKGQLLHKSVDLFFTVTNMKNKLVDLYGN